MREKGRGRRKEKERGERMREGGGQVEKEGNISLLFAGLLSNSHNTWAQPVQSKAWNFIQVPHAGGRGPSTRVIICGVSRCFSRELGRKCSSQDSNRFPHGMPALQAAPQSRSLLQSTLEIACRNWRQLIFFKTYLPQRLILNSLKYYEIQMNYQSSNTVFSLMLLLRSL